MSMLNVKCWKKQKELSDKDIVVSILQALLTFECALEQSFFQNFQAEIKHSLEQFWINQ